MKHFTTAMGRDYEYGARLREIVRARKPSADCRRPKSAELCAGIPSFGEIHLSKPGND
jgi:hypothetical protein